MQKKPDFSIFYSLEIINTQRQAAAKQPQWGQFISPQQQLTIELNAPSFESIDFKAHQNQNPLFDNIVAKLQTVRFSQNHFRCSAKYYAECFELVLQHTGKVNRIVEVGVGEGDLSCFFAGALNAMDATLDLVDTHIENLLQAYTKIQRLFPEVVAKVRLFFGDLPLYVKHVSTQSPYVNLIHYQASNNFNDVVRDLGATYYAKDKIVGVMLHNTHLRSTNMNDYAFTDVAVYALFGFNVQFLKLGEEASSESELNTEQQTYLASSRIDGMYLPYSHNTFRYPHPETPLDAFFENNDISPAVA